MSQPQTETPDTPNIEPVTTEPQEDNPVPPGPLAAKIAKAMLEIERVPKNGTNDFHDYQYATADDVMGVARQALGKVGVAIFPSVIDEEWGKRSTNRGTRKVLRLTMEYTVIDGESGAQWTCHWRAESEDDSDKAFYKAYTQGRKYFLRELLNIDTGEPLDVEFEPNPGRRPSDRQPSGEIAGINHGGGHGSKPNPRDQERRHELEKGLEQLLEAVDVESDAEKQAFKDWAVDRAEGKTSWQALTNNSIEDLSSALRAYASKGGALSPRRLFLDRRLVQFEDGYTPGADWQATGGESDDWDQLNRRWRALTNEAASGDGTLERYHEAIKARHDVSSFNDLTAAQLMDDIHQLEARKPTHPEGGMSERLDYMLAEIDEHLPSSEDLFAGGDRHTGQDPGANREEMREGPKQGKENRTLMALGKLANRPTYLGEIVGLVLDAIREDERLSADDGLGLLAEMRDWAEVEDNEDLEELDLSWWTDKLDVELDERADWLVDYLDVAGEE